MWHENNHFWMSVQFLLLTEANTLLCNLLYIYQNTLFWILHLFLRSDVEDNYYGMLCVYFSENLEIELHKAQEGDRPALEPVGSSLYLEIWTFYFRFYIMLSVIHTYFKGFLRAGICEVHEMGDVLWLTFVIQTRRPDRWPRETATWTWFLYLFESEKAHQRGDPRLSYHDGWFTWEKTIEASFPEHSRAFSSHLVTIVKAFLTLVARPLWLQAWVRTLIKVIET